MIPPEVGMSRRARHVARCVLVALIMAGGLGPSRSALETVCAQDDLSGRGRQLYDQIRAFKLTGGSADVSNLTLKRDRVEMTFTGTFYFAGAIDGAVTGAVFSGQGTMKADAPNDIERDNVRRLIAADGVDTDFKTAVLRFSDDTFALISSSRKDGTAPAAVQKLANDADAGWLQEIGANIPSRLATSILNQTKPGVFVAQFDGGRRGRLNYLFDPQARMPVARFNLNAGEKGIIYQYQNAIFFPEVWLAFGSLEDYTKKTISYSDVYDLVDVSNYRLGVDLRDYGVVLSGLIEMTVKGEHVRAIPFNVGESLSASQKMRLDNQLRVKRIRLGDKELAFTQEDWEGGFTVYLPQTMETGGALQLNVELAGAFLRKVSNPDCYYPYSNTDWLPRHGYLDRATFDLTFRHRKNDRVASIGKRVSEDVDPGDQQSMLTHYRMEQPVALAVFALGPWQRKAKQVTFEGGGAPIQIEFNSLPNLSVKEDFFLEELDNVVRFFAAMFGPYPYPVFGAAIHPFAFGQGFPTLLMIPPVQRTGVTVRDSDIYSFIAHEASHQWWGNIVAWRSYRDQWLSEGFAEYSGVLYASRRGTDPAKTTLELLRDMREQLRNPPQTVTGIAKGRLNDIGPIVQGVHLQSTRTFGAYQALIYAKGGLVLRMLHFLMSDPTNGNDAAFMAMMKDFVDQHRNGSASTEDFWRVASIHFARTKIAGKFGMMNLDWFFKQWVYGTGLPSYSLDYETKAQPDGSLMLTGTVKQDNVPADWQMVLPLVMSFDGNQEARTSVLANGASTPFQIKVPAKPKKVELDPFNWVLSEKTASRGK